MNSSILKSKDPPRPFERTYLLLTIWPSPGNRSFLDCSGRRHRDIYLAATLSPLLGSPSPARSMNCIINLIINLKATLLVVNFHGSPAPAADGGGAIL